MPSRTALACLAAALVACSGSSNPPASDAGGPPAPDGGARGDAGSPDGGSPACRFGGDGTRAVGWACNAGADCASGRCFVPVDYSGVAGSYCTEPCAIGDATCPTGFACEAIGAGATPDLCAPTPGTALLPHDQSGKLGDPCNADRDCASGSTCQNLVDRNGTVSFCSPACDPSAADSCGQCGSCLALAYDQNSNPVYGCAPKGPKGIGEACTTNLDCQTFDCQGFCTQACGGVNGIQCPDGTVCQTANAYQSLCVEPSAVGGTLEGAPCQFDFQCASGDVCADPHGTGTTTCVKPGALGASCQSNSDCGAGLRCATDASSGELTCQPAAEDGDTCAGDSDCAAGLFCRGIAYGLRVCTRSCTPACDSGTTCAAIDIDTSLALFDSNAAGTAPIARNDDIDFQGGNHWSEIDHLTLEPGSYWVKVADLSESVGSYQLSILVSGATPASATESPETSVRNDSAATAQPLDSIPVVVAGNFGTPADVDYYQFTVASTVAATLETGPGGPSACLPDAKLGKTALGGTCDFDGYCASDLCEAALGVCGKSCATDADCGDGASCVDLGSHHTCVLDSTVGQDKNGTACVYGFQCKGGLCVTFRGAQFCSQPCDDPQTEPCPFTTECTSVQVQRNGQSAAVQGCVPDGDQSAPFNADCVLNSDCQESLSCVDGRCGGVCYAAGGDADCPNQKFPPSPTPPAVDCQACQTDQDCGGGAALCEMLRADDYESACVEPCAADGTCPIQGFSCRSISGVAQKYCLPDEASCRRPVCTIPSGQPSGLCTVPRAALAELCSASSECTTGLCADGFCSEACSPGSSCDCPTGDLVCGSQGQCVPADMPTEVEPDDNDLQAQTLTGPLPIELVGKLVPENGQPDVDDYSVELKAGDAITVTTRPLCGSAAALMQTAVRILVDGNPVAAGAQSESYDSVSYTAPADGTYVVQVSDPTPQGEPPGAYVLEIKKQ